MQDQKYKCKDSGHQEKPQAVDCQRLPGVQSHGQEKDRFRQLVRKCDSQPGQIPVAGKPYGEGVPGAAWIYLKAACAHGFIGAGFVADANVAGKDAGGT